VCGLSYVEGGRILLGWCWDFKRRICILPHLPLVSYTVAAAMGSAVYYIYSTDACSGYRFTLLLIDRRIGETIENSLSKGGT